MIEQIYTYFNIDMIFMWLNLGVLPFWLILVIFPQSKICRVFIASIFPIFILSLVYGYLLYLFVNEGYDFLKNLIEIPHFSKKIFAPLLPYLGFLFILLIFFRKTIDPKW